MTSKSLCSVPDSALQNLRCCLCNDYLSQFPVHVCKEMGSVCGRCPVLLDDNPIRNKAYEIIAETLSFPCRYSSLGCLELLTPKQLVEHEETCTYRQYFCPFMPSGCCPWQGPSNELMSHFQEKHSIFILEENMFEIDFTTKYSENYLMSDMQHLFVVHKKCDVYENKFWCAISFIGSKKIAERYNFQLILSVKGRENCPYVLPHLPVRCFTNPNLDENNAMKINADDVMIQLNNPASVVCNVVVFRKTENNENNLSEKRMISVDSIEEDILNDLECPVCFEFMVPPIYQCETGHSVCGTCKSNVNECPSCKQFIRETRNFHLERITNRIKYYCKYRDYGCPFITSAKDIKQHEIECKHGPFRCPLYDHIACNWKGKFADIMPHIRHSHDDNVLEMEKISVPYEESDFEHADEDCFILQTAGELFKLMYKYENRCFYWAVQLIGPFNEARKFFFMLDIIDNKNLNQRFFMKRYCTPLTPKCDAFVEKENYVKIPLDLIECMIDNSLTYRVHITQA